MSGEGPGRSGAGWGARVSPGPGGAGGGAEVGGTGAGLIERRRGRGGVRGRANWAGAGPGAGRSGPALPALAPRAALLAGKAAPAAAALPAVAPARCASRRGWAPQPPAVRGPGPSGDPPPPSTSFRRGGAPALVAHPRGSPLPPPTGGFPAELAGAPNFASSPVAPSGREPAHLRSGRAPGDRAPGARAGAPPLQPGEQRVAGNSREVAGGGGGCCLDILRGR